MNYNLIPYIIIIIIIDIMCVVQFDKFTHTMLSRTTHKRTLMSRTHARLSSRINHQNAEI